MVISSILAAGVRGLLGMGFKSATGIGMASARVGATALTAAAKTATGAGMFSRSTVGKTIFTAATFGFPIWQGISSINNGQARRRMYEGAVKTPFNKPNVMPATRVFGPGYETAAVKYNLSQSYQNRGQSALQSSTEGLSLSLYNIRKRGLL